MNIKKILVAILVIFIILVVFTFIANIGSIIAEMYGYSGDIVYMIVLIIAMFIIKFSWKKLV